MKILIKTQCIVQLYVCVFLIYLTFVASELNKVLVFLYSSQVAMQIQEYYCSSSVGGGGTDKISPAWLAQWLEQTPGVTAVAGSSSSLGITLSPRSLYY